MKIINHIQILFFISIVIFTSCSEQNGQEKTAAHRIDTKRPAKIKFTETAKDLGTLTEGEKVEVMFRYRNIGGMPLKITSAKADCACTVPELTKKELYENEEASLKVIFDSQGFMGNVLKIITITTNTGETQKLMIAALIEPAYDLQAN